jgi:hypothetical protein
MLGLKPARLTDLMLDRGDDEGRLVWNADQPGDQGATGAVLGATKLRHRPSTTRDTVRVRDLLV